MGLIRKLTEKEIGLVSYLANKANYKLQPNWLENVDIMPLDDGGMGSMVLCELDIWKTDFSPLIEIPCTFC